MYFEKDKINWLKWEFCDWVGTKYYKIVFLVIVFR